MTITMFQVVFSTLALLRLSVSAGSLPTVNLGYVQQQATTYNKTTDIYIFSNVRYARPPVDELRWVPPQAPLPEHSVQNGSQARICFQAQPSWQLKVLGPWIDAISSNQTEKFYEQFPEEPVPTVSSNLTDMFGPPLPEETEDCLFLDVHVSRTVFERGTKQPASVLVWVHGGGLTLGSKTADGDHSALVAQSMLGGSSPLIVVSINYRLGAFGFLGGPLVRSDSGISNVGLLDQAFALDWVKAHIAKFGGDPNDITIAGESAGGASIIHHIVRDGGRGPAPVFSKALIQSGGWNPTRTTKHLDQMYGKFKSTLGVKNIKEARLKPALDLRNANFLHVWTLRWGGLAFGVEADGVLIPEPAPLLLSAGRFHRNISIMTGQNAAEGVLFASPWTRNSNETRQFMKTALPDTPMSEIQYIEGHLYPPPTPRDALGYVNRTQHLAAEAGILCQSAFLAHAFGRKTYNYLFAVPPAWHGSDLGYTFYDGSDPSIDASVARDMQQRFLDFVQTGNPNNGSSNAWQQYGERAFTLEFSASTGSNTTSSTRNPGENSRCTKWWSNEFYHWK